MSWQLWEHEDHKYLIHSHFESNLVTVKITNMIQFWSKSLSDKEVIGLFQDQNPLVEAPEESLVKHIQNILDLSKSTVEVDAMEKNNKVFLKFISKFQGIPFSLGFLLELKEPTVLFNEITIPLLLTVQNLQSQQKYLFDQLRKKDMEIDEYKLEGFQLTRKNVETAKFNKNTFSEMPLSVKSVNSAEIFSVIPQCKIFGELHNLTVKQSRINTESVKLLPEIASNNLEYNWSSSTNEACNKKDIKIVSSDDEVANVSSETGSNFPQKNIDISQNVKKRKLNP